MSDRKNSFSLFSISGFSLPLAVLLGWFCFGGSVSFNVVGLAWLLFVLRWFSGAVVQDVASF